MKKYQKTFIIILLCSPVVSWLAILILHSLIKQFPALEMFAVGSTDAWIGFLGSTIGTIITVLTVILTLSRDEESEKKSIKPVIEVFPKHEGVVYQEPSISEYGTDYYILDFTIEVLSSNSAKNFELKNFAFHFDGNEKTSLLNDNGDLLITTLINPYNHGKISITPTHSTEIGLTYRADEIHLKKEDNFFSHSFVKFVFSFNDIHDNPPYLQEFTFDIVIVWDQSDRSLDFSIYESTSELISEKERKAKYPDPV